MANVVRDPKEHPNAVLGDFTHAELPLFLEPENESPEYFELGYHEDSEQ
jgi:hypothetical protein